MPDYRPGFERLRRQGWHDGGVGYSKLVGIEYLEANPMPKPDKRMLPPIPKRAVVVDDMGKMKEGVVVAVSCDHVE